jgi:hypothetical protein
LKLISAEFTLILALSILSNLYLLSESLVERERERECFVNKRVHARICESTREVNDFTRFVDTAPDAYTSVDFVH